MTLDTFIFIVSALTAVFGATMMISLRNPVLSVMSLILSLVAQAVLYIQLGAMFIGAVLIIVYSGAILVLFLFVIMLLNLRGTEDLGKPSNPTNLFIKVLLSLLLFAELVFVVYTSLFKGRPPLGIMNMNPEGFGSAAVVARLIFTKYLYPFELTSVLLLAAIVGAVVMARKEVDGETDDSEMFESDSTEGKPEQVEK